MFVTVADIVIFKRTEHIAMVMVAEELSGRVLA